MAEIKSGLHIEIFCKDKNSDEQNEIREELANILLKSRLLKSVLFEDDQPSVYDLLKSDKPISKTMFPMITKIIKTGSRAEQVHLEQSDVDYMYEIGPAVVTTNNFNYQENKCTLDKFIRYNIEATQNVGFYNIQDAYGGFVYPVVMQAKVAPLIERSKTLAELEKVGASLPEHQSKTKGEDEDEVIALKCLEWPTEVWKDFESRKSKLIFSSIMDKLREESLYLVPKSHPKSEDPWIEWRLSFSMIEIVIIRNLPYIFRKVLLLCKELSYKLIDYERKNWRGGTIPNHLCGTSAQRFRKKYNKQINTNKVTSYILKTVFLWKCEEWYESGKKYTEDDLFDMIKQVFVDIKKRCADDKMIPHYFLPTMNLMDFFDEEEASRVANPSYLDQLNKDKLLIDNIIGTDTYDHCPLITIGPYWSMSANFMAANDYTMFTREFPIELQKTQRYVYLMVSYIKGKIYRNVAVNEIDLVIEIYCVFLDILKNMHELSISNGVRAGRYALYALKTFDASFQMELISFTQYCESLFKNVEKMNTQKEVFQFDIEVLPKEIDNQLKDNFFWKCDIEFRALTSKINLHLNEKKTSFMARIDDLPFFKDLVQHVSVMLNLKLQDPGFSVPTPGTYLAYLSTKNS